MKLHTVFITHNRLELTKRTIESYLETVTVPFSACVVDNASEDAVQILLIEGEFDTHLLNENHYPGFACNYGWGKAPEDATHLHRSDNDMEYCVAPETLVLGADYEWRHAGELGVGFPIVAFDEHVPASCPGKQRTLQPAKIVGAKNLKQPSSRISTDCSPDTVASDTHLWLVLDSEGPSYLRRTPKWKDTRALVPGDRILRFSDTWSATPYREEAAYLAGLFDGEGCLSAGQLTFSQRPGAVLERGITALHRLGFALVRTAYESHGTVSPRVKGGIPEVMRFLYQVPTSRFREGPFWQGRQIVRKNGGPPHYAVVEAVEPVGVHDVVALTTTTGTLITNGLYSHNCPGWCEEVAHLFQSEKVGQVGLRTDAEDEYARNTGGNCVIRRELFDAGLRYDERPWPQIRAEVGDGYSEDSFFSSQVKQMGYTWTRVRRPCIRNLASGDWKDPYYQQSYGVRGIRPRRDDPTVPEDWTGGYS